MSERPEELQLTALESALRDLQPMPDTLRRDVLMYCAGRASARRWAWPTATALATAAALVLGIVLVKQPAPHVVERVVYLPAPADAAPETPGTEGGEGRGSWSSYVHLLEKVADHGPDALPPETPEQPPSLDALLRSF
jgi:hypothetical protein